MNPFGNVRGTYRQIRLTAGWTLFLAPLLIIAVAYLIEPAIQPTLSHYYFVEPKPGLVRTMFTGFLIFVGGILVAYRGFDTRDNWIHNAAGIFAVCVAIFPKHCDPTGEPYCYPGLLGSLHQPAAMLLFFFAGWAVVYCGGPVFLGQLQEDELRTLKRAKKASLTTMTIGALLYLVRPFLPAAIQEFKITTLLVELLGFFGFAAHWLVMTRVISTANVRRREERRAAREGKRALAAEVETEKVLPEESMEIDAEGEGALEIP